ncbi:hypothetical protein [Sporosalibacterium faouarense]|uniref:hypothetical protein n=1 Tax=Sporosalibacterium faouarense TaxID=516123 RepID=UPI00192CC9D6|nr:hypothetical protein [Sporosalibacterium faouarense]
MRQFLNRKESKSRNDVKGYICPEQCMGGCDSLCIGTCKDTCDAECMDSCSSTCVGGCGHFVVS